MAFQLTNIIRDVGEDARRGRIYLPIDELQRFEVPAATILDARYSDNFRRLIEFQIERAENLYEQALAALPAHGIRTLMVEGGARIISTFLREHLVNYCVITITPRIIGGVKAIDGLHAAGTSPMSLTDCRYQPLGADLIAFWPVRYG